MSIEDPRIARLREEIEIDVEDGLPNSMSSISAIQYLLAAYDDQRRKIDAALAIDYEVCYDAHDYATAVGAAHPACALEGPLVTPPTDPTPYLTVEEIRTAVNRMQRELDKHDDGPYGVTFESDFSTVVATARQWIEGYDDLTEKMADAWDEGQRSQKFPTDMTYGGQQVVMWTIPQNPYRAALGGQGN